MSTAFRETPPRVISRAARPPRAGRTVPARPRAPGTMRPLVRRLFGCAAGVSAVEFALLAPVLVLGAFGTADAGMAIYERMMIGQALRAAAQGVMSGADEDDARAVLQEVASQNFVVAQDGAADGEASQDGALSITVSQYWACPGETFVQVASTVVCDSGLGPTEFYQLTASKTFDGVMLPDFGLSGSVTVLAQ